MDLYAGCATYSETCYARGYHDIDLGVVSLPTAAGDALGATGELYASGALLDWCTDKDVDDLTWSCRTDGEVPLACYEFVGKTSYANIHAIESQEAGCAETHAWISDGIDAQVDGLCAMVSPDVC